MEALNGANIPTIGPALTWWGDNPRSVNVGSRMSAVLDADNARDAESRVRDILPPHRGYTVEQAKSDKQDS